MNQERIKELAIAHLQGQIDQLGRELAELRGQAAVRPELAPSQTQKPSRARRKMTAKERKEHSERMKAVWLNRRKKAKV